MQFHQGGSCVNSPIESYRLVTHSCESISMQLGNRSRALDIVRLFPRCSTPVLRFLHPSDFTHPMPIHEEQLKIPVSIDKLFDFLLKPSNVVMVSDPATGISLQTAPEEVALGSIITFRIAAFGQIREITHEITVLDHGIQVVEEQREGPMKSWRHEHIYEADGDGTILIERVVFEPPGGLVGLLVTADKVVDQLADGMYYKEQALRKLAKQGVI